MSGPALPDLLQQTKPRVSRPWKVIVLDDPVNLMGYVTMVFMKVFSFSKAKAERHMTEVHERGRSILWTGEREKAEMYAQQLQAHQLSAILERDE